MAYGQEESFANGWLFINLVALWLRAFGVKGHITIQTDWGEEFGGKSGRKLEKMNKSLAGLDAEVTRIQKGRKEQNGYIERSHRTDDEELYIPYGEEIKDVATHFSLAYGWALRAHYGKELDGLTPLEYLKGIMPAIDGNIALMPPLFLDKVTTHPRWQGGYHVCEHYILVTVPRHKYRYWMALKGVIDQASCSSRTYYAGHPAQRGRRREGLKVAKKIVKKEIFSVQFYIQGDDDDRLGGSEGG